MELHPYEISPGQPFSILFFIRNHTDPSTYYVRARIYDVATGELLSTVDLTQAATNSRLFTATTQAPPDPVGYGRNIVAIATVYTDASYATRSDAYEEEEQYYLVKTTAPVLGGGGVDYRVLREIVQEELAKLPKAPEPLAPTEPDMSFVPALFGALGALQREIDRIPKEVLDLSGLEGRLASLDQALRALPEPEKPDLSPLGASIGQAAREIATARSEAKRANSSIAETLSRLVNEVRTLAPAIAQSVDDALASQEMTVTPTRRTAAPQPQARKPLPDIRSLMRV
jgi:hypothetical protein